MDITKEKLLELGIEDFNEKLVKLASQCKTKEDIKGFEKFLEDASWEDAKSHGRRQDYQKIFDQALMHINTMLKNAIGGSGVEEEVVMEVQVKDNIIVGYKSLEEVDK
jgi:hypothetical protein